MNTSKIINLLNIQNIHPIGSYNDPKILYKNDVDLQDFITKPVSLEEIYKKFKNIFKVAKKNPNLYITDFKCGVNPRGNIPLRWNYKSLKDGYQYIENQKFLFIHSLLQKSVIKIDLVATIRKVYHEFSCNYYLVFNNINTQPFVEKSIKKSLRLDSIKLAAEGKMFKSLKRLYNLYKLEDNKERVKELLKIFNSPVGKLYKQASQLGTIDLVINNTFKKPKEKDIINNIKKVREKLPSSYHHLIDKILDGSKNDRSKNIHVAIIDINDSINNFLKSKPNIYK